MYSGRSEDVARCGDTGELVNPHLCHIYTANSYSSSPQNVEALRKIRARPVRVGAFTSVEPGRSVLMGWHGKVGTPEGEPYSEYVRRALISELESAGLYSEQSPITLTGRLNEFDLRHEVMFRDAYWIFSLTLTSSNGQSITEVEEYHWIGNAWIESYIALNKLAASKLRLAVQNLIARIIHNPNFHNLVEAK